MKYKLAITVFFLTCLVEAANAQTESLCIRSSLPCASHYEMCFFEDSIGITYAWAKPSYNTSGELVANRGLMRIGRNKDTLSACFDDVDGFIPYAYLIVNECPRLVYVKAEKNQVHLAYKLIDPDRLETTGELISIISVPCANYAWPPEQVIGIKQSEDLSKTILYCHYWDKQERDCMTWMRSYNEEWQSLTDTTLKLSRLFEKPKNSSAAPLVEITDEGNIYLVTRSRYHTEDIWYGPKRRDMLVARISGNTIVPLDFSFNESIDFFTLKVHGDIAVFAGTCCYGKSTFEQWAKYGTFAYVFNAANDKAISTLVRPAEQNYSKDEGNDQVKYLILCDLVFTDDGKFWLVTQNYWDAEKEFICHLFSSTGDLINTSKVYRKYSRTGMGYGRAGIEFKQPFPLQGFSISCKGENLYIFFHDNPNNDLKSNSPQRSELDYNTGEFNLVAAKVLPSGEVKRMLIHTFTESEPPQQHNSVLVYADNHNYYHLNCYTGEGKNWQMYHGTFTLSEE